MFFKLLLFLASENTVFCDVTFVIALKPLEPQIQQQVTEQVTARRKASAFPVK